MLRCGICEAQLTPPVAHITVISKCVPHRIGESDRRRDAETACAMQAIHWITAQASIPDDTEGHCTYWLLLAEEPKGIGDWKIEYKWT